MTIAAVFVTEEGVVFGTDSTTTFSIPVPNGQPLLKFFNNAQKVFAIGNVGQARIGLCTWGDGTLGELSHRAVVAGLATKLGPNTKVSETIDALIQIGTTPEATKNRSFVGYYLGGVDPGASKPICSAVLFSKADPPKVEPIKIGTAQFAGAPRFFSRVEHGYDPDLPVLLRDALREKLGASPPTDFDKLFDDALSEAKQRLPQALSSGVPLRDAIDWVHMYLHLTIKAHKFLIGPTVCGGPIEIGFVTVDRPFRWIRHKPFDSAMSEVE